MEITICTLDQVNGMLLGQLSTLLSEYKTLTNLFSGRLEYLSVIPLIKETLRQKACAFNISDNDKVPSLKRDIIKFGKEVFYGRFCSSHHPFGSGL